MVCVRVLRKACGLGFAAAFGHRFGEIGEQHGEPEPDRESAATKPRSSG